MSKKDTNEKKPFYKKWWFWLLIVILVLGGLGYLGSDKDKEKPVSQNAKSAENTKKKMPNTSKKGSKLLMDNKEFGGLTKDIQNPEKVTLDDVKEYNVNWSDNSWSGLKVSIDKAVILKVSNYEGISKNSNYQGFVLLHFNVDNTERDIEFYPQQGTLVTNTGEQSEGDYLLEQFDGDILKGTKKSGYASFPLKKLDDVKSINNLRVKFHGSYNTDDYDDNANKEYDVTIDLK